MPSKPFNLSNYPGETKAHIGYVSCPKTTLLQSGRTRTHPTKKRSLDVDDDDDDDDDDNNRHFW